MVTKVKQKSTVPVPQIEIVAETVEEANIEPAQASWLTLEILLYTAILITGLSLRLWGLGHYPLSDVEAQQSLVALRLAQTEILETNTSYSPLLASLNALTFFLLHESETTARLASVLLGTMLILLPMTLRRQLGTPVCLLASALLAISPTAVFLSRTLNNEIGVAAGALMIIAGFFNWVQAGQKRWLYLFAGGAAILLTAGPMAYSLIIVFAVMLLFRLAAFRALWTQGLNQAALQEPQIQRAKSNEPSEGFSPAYYDNPPLHENLSAARPAKSRDSGEPVEWAGDQPSAAVFSEETSRAERTTLNETSPLLEPALNAVEGSGEAPGPALSKAEGMRAIFVEEANPGSTALTSPFRQAGIFLVAALLLLSTTATLNLSGFSVTTGLFGDWLSRFSFQPRFDSGFNAVFVLTIYETMIVIAGLIGLTFVILRGDLLRFILAVWFVGSITIDLVMAGRPTANVILSVVPLAFLAAIALAELWEGLRAWGSWNNEGLILVSGLVITGFGYIGLTGWLARDCTPEDRFCELAWLQAVAALTLFLIIVIFFWLVNGPGIAIRGLTLTGVVVGLLVMINIGWRLNYGPLMDLAYQPLAGVPASTRLVDLTETLTGESIIRTDDKSLLDITLLAATPALQWQLRDFENVTQAASLAEVTPTSAIITSTANNEGLDLSEAYLGQDFTINAFWSPVGLPPKELIHWLVYREPTPKNQPPQGEQVILWLRMSGG